MIFFLNELCDKIPFSVLIPPRGIEPLTSLTEGKEELDRPTEKANLVV